MQKTTLLKLYFCVLFLYYPFTYSYVHAQTEYKPVSIEAISNLPLSLDYVSFPIGDVDFNNIPFYIPTSGNSFLATHNVACQDCPYYGTLEDLNIGNVRKIWLLVNSSDSFTIYNGQNYAYIELTFSDNSSYQYDFIVGENVREWLQSGNYGATVNSVSTEKSIEVWKGYRPNGEYPVIADLLEIELPEEYSSKTLSSIKFVDDSISRVNIGNPQDPGLIIKGVTVEHEDFLTPTLTLTHPWQDDNNQLPIDRKALVEVAVNENNVPRSNVTVEANVVDGVGELHTFEATTDTQGKAIFEFTPTGIGAVTLKFFVGDQAIEETFTVYRPPVVIVPGHGGSYSGKEILLGEFDQTWGWFTDMSYGVWNEVIDVLQANDYVEGSTYKVVFYDWRKSLTGSDPVAIDRFLVPTINSLLNTRPAGQKVNILAHSFGGLVSRSYIERFDGADKVNSLMTFGTPHRGSVNAYYTWEGGVVAPSGDPVYRSSVGALQHLIAYVGGYANRAQAVRSTIPSVRELLPVFSPYLYRPSVPGFVPTAQLTVAQNPLLESVLNIDTFVQNVSESNIRYDNVQGAAKDTIASIEVQYPANETNMWEDGKPTGVRGKESGDNTVSLVRSQISELYDQTAQGDHGDLPALSIASIRERLKLNNYQPALKKMPKKFVAVMILSPAEAVITNSQGVVLSDTFDLGDGEHELVYVADPSDGSLQVKVTGTGNGSYQLFANSAADTSYDELLLQRTIALGEVQTIPLTLSPTGLDRLIGGTFAWNVPGIVIRQNRVYSQITTTLPQDLALSDLSLQTLYINNSPIKIHSSTYQQRKRLLRMEVRGADVAKVLGNVRGRQQIELSLQGEDVIYKGKLHVVLPGNWQRILGN